MTIVKVVGKAAHAVKACAMWAEFTENDRTGIRFGLFPFAKMKAAAQEGYDGKELCVALMDVAQRNGGMRA
jgi:hypothetical protein